jgi:putative DNA primase/helicase
MRFEDFCRAHGLRVQSVVIGKWMAVPTDDHPRKRNGRYKYLGDVGWVQNWATMTSPEMWRSGEERPPAIQRIVQNLDRDREEAAQRAAEKAAYILANSTPSTHPYLEKKGFKDEAGMVYNGLLVIPMRLGARLVGVQLIGNEGDKKFLQGQRTQGASFLIDARGLPIFCEGYATGLSIRAVMRAMKIPHTIYVCFSAGNLQEVARRIHGGIVVADNDPNHVGKFAAEKTGKPYWLSETVGDDFNDYHVRAGLFQATQSLRVTVSGA